MPVDAQTEVKWFRAETMNDLTANGGRMSNSEIVSEVKQNIFPHASQAQRTAGADQVRKAFIKNVNADDISMVTPKIFVMAFTGGADAIVIHEGTQTDTQNDLTGAERVYGCGSLDEDTTSDDMSLKVLTEGEDLDYFQPGDKIIIFSLDTGGEIDTFEYATIDPSSSVSYVGDVATLTLSAPLQGMYDNLNAFVASVIEADDIVATVGDAIVTSAAGTFNDGSNPILGHNDGSIEQNWTLTFTSGSAFTVSGDTVGSVGSGSTAAPFAPTNPGTDAPYFTIDHLAFGGTFISGNTITFTTHPAAVPIWYHRIIPAGAAQFTNDYADVAVDYESA